MRIDAKNLPARGRECLLAARDDASPRAIAAAMLVCNLGAVAVLGATGVRFPSAGLLLWLEVIFHAAMAYGCGRIFSRKLVDAAAPR